MKLLEFENGNPEAGIRAEPHLHILFHRRASPVLAGRTVPFPRLLPLLRCSCPAAALYPLLRAVLDLLHAEVACFGRRMTAGRCFLAGC